MFSSGRRLPGAHGSYRIYSRNSLVASRALRATAKVGSSFVVCGIMRADRRQIPFVRRSYWRPSIDHWWIRLHRGPVRPVRPSRLGRVKLAVSVFPVVSQHRAGHARLDGAVHARRMGDDRRRPLGASHGSRQLDPSDALSYVPDSTSRSSGSWAPASSCSASRRRSPS